MQIKTSEIVWRKDLYPRLEPNAEQIKTYSENWELLPPIDINQNNILIDGYHRWRAFQTVKEEMIPVNVIETESEAALLMLSIKKNSIHGLQLTPKDKKRYVLRWWDTMPDKEICETLSISQSTFNRWTSGKRTEKEKEIKQEIIERWMRCETQDEIAKAVNVSQQYVAKIAKNTTDTQVRNHGIFRNLTPEIYTIWNFGKSTNKVKHFGNIPPEILDNLLYKYTKPFDVVYDPFAGGGMTIDVCKKRKRRYYVSDLTPIPARITEIKQHDITSGLPDDLPVPDFVFLDPPYWKQAEKKYSDKETDLSNVDLDCFLKTIGDIAKNIKRKWSNKLDARLAIITGICKMSRGDANLPSLCFNIINKYLVWEDSYVIPYPTQIYGGAHVKHAKENNKSLYIQRILDVFKVSK